MKRRSGFTLIELLTVIAIAGVLAGLGLSSVQTIKQSSNLNDGVQGLVSVLRLVQSQAIAGQGNADHAVRITSGTGYSALSGSTVTNSYNVNGATLSTPSGFPLDIVFARLKGTATLNGTVTACTTSTCAVTITTANSKTIQVSPLGVVTVQ